MKTFVYLLVITSWVKNAKAVEHLTTILMDSTSVWMKFLLPRNLVEECYTVLIKKGPIPVLTKQLKLSLRNNDVSQIYRTWHRQKFAILGST